MLDLLAALALILLGLWLIATADNYPGRRDCDSRYPSDPNRRDRERNEAWAGQRMKDVYPEVESE